MCVDLQTVAALQITSGTQYSRADCVRKGSGTNGDQPGSTKGREADAVPALHVASVIKDSICSGYFDTFDISTRPRRPLPFDCIIESGEAN